MKVMKVKIKQGSWIMYGGVPLILNYYEAKRFIETKIMRRKNGSKTNELEFIR